MPVVFVTSSNNCAAEVEALVARGAVLAQFGKPFDAPDFLAAIERARVQ